MTADEVGLLVIKLQDDNCFAHELRKFLRVLITDPEVQRNAKLVGALCTIPSEQRTALCRANALFLLSDAELVPAEFGTTFVTPVSAGSNEMVFKQRKGPWGAHIKAVGVVPTAEEIARGQRGHRRSAVVLPRMWVSSSLRCYLTALQDFWGVPGTFV